MMDKKITLEKAIAEHKGEPYTVGTEYGEGWCYYFDGEKLHEGTNGASLGDMLDRYCVEVYDRPERKHWSDWDKKANPYMELEAGLAFIVTGRENGRI